MIFNINFDLQKINFAFWFKFKSIIVELNLNLNRKVDFLQIKVDVEDQLCLNFIVITVIPFAIFSHQKANVLAFFSRRTWQRPTIWTINIYRDHFIFYWVFFRWKKKKFHSKNHTSFNRRLSVAKKTEGNMTTVKWKC